VRKDFKTSNPVRGDRDYAKNFIDNYVSRTPSETPLAHKFRDEDKTKFMSSKSFRRVV
jgi:hypothetical protein